jgi:hypothetical protein
LTEATLLASNTDPQTSHDAADLAISKAAVVRRRVFDIFANFPNGLTDEEMTGHYFYFEEQLGWDQVNHETPRKRRSQLSGAGRLIPTGDRRRGQMVWSVNA